MLSNEWFITNDRLVEYIGVDIFKNWSNINLCGSVLLRETNFSQNPEPALTADRGSQITSIFHIMLQISILYLNYLNNILILAFYAAILATE